ncbi:MAG: PHB depolymerase family esterase [Candidatus Korobacteraceae bacterium]
MSTKRFTIVVAILIACASGLVLRRAIASTSAHFSTIDVNGRSREYILHVPPSYNGKVAAPLVIVLHGAVQGAANAQQMSGMSSLADQQNFIAVYPNGTGRLVTWNAGNCCGYAQRENVDDIAFLRALVAKLQKNYSIDARRIYVAGISNGAMMSYRAACEMSDVVAAVAPVEGAQNVPCKPSAPVSLIVFHGTADRLVPYNGGSTPFQIGPHRNDASVADTVGFWVKENGCAPAAKREESKDVKIDIYSGCKDGTGVALYTIQGGHHLWPGTPISHVDLSATDVMWKFFAQHPKA